MNSTNQVVNMSKRSPNRVIIPGEWTVDHPSQLTWSHVRTQVIKQAQQGPVNLLQWLRDGGGITSGHVAVNVVLEAQNFEHYEDELRLVMISRKTQVRFDDCVVTQDTLVQVRAGGREIV